MRILGVDPSPLNTAYVDLDTRKVRDGPMRDYGMVQNKLKGIPRVSQLGFDFNELLEGSDIQLVAIEGYAYKGKNVITMAEVGFMYRYVCFLQDIPCIDIAPTTLKSFVLGKGKGDKNEIMREVYKRWGFEGNEHECDAYGMAMFAMACFIDAGMPSANMMAVRRYKTNHKHQLQSIAQHLEIEFE